MQKFNTREEYEKWKKERLEATRDEQHKRINEDQLESAQVEPSAQFVKNPEISSPSPPQNSVIYNVIEKEINPMTMSENLGVGTQVGCGSAILCFIAGGIITLIPVIGWFLGPIIIFSGCIAPFVGIGSAVKDSVTDKPTLYKGISGPCPYCKGSNTVEVKNFTEVIGVDCPICKKRFVVRDKEFHSV